VGGHVKSVPGSVLRNALEDSMTPLPGVPGIIEGSMTVIQEPDGRMSFRVLISANGERADCCDRIELIINPEHVRQALAGTEARPRHRPGSAGSGLTCCSAARSRRAVTREPAGSPRATARS
jgi:hypothetical protein